MQHDKKYTLIGIIVTIIISISFFIISDYRDNKKIDELNESDERRHSELLQYSMILIPNTNQTAQNLYKNTLNKAYQFIQDEKYVEAITLYDSILDENPDELEALTFKGLSLFYLGELEKSLELQEIALLKNANDVRTLSVKAFIFSNNGQHADALILLDKAYVLDPEDPVVLNNRAYEMEFFEKDIEAIKLLNKANKINSNESLYHARLGTIFWLNNDIEQATFHFDAALAINPNNETVLINKSTMIENVNEYQKEIDSYNEKLVDDPDNQDILIKKAFSLQNIGKKSEALIIYDDILNNNYDLNDKNKADIMVSKGMIALHDGRYLEALQYFDKAVEVGLDEPLEINLSTERQYRCAIFDNLGSYRDALKCYEILIEEGHGYMTTEGKKLAEYHLKYGTPL